jgi:TonB family protein
MFTSSTSAKRKRPIVPMIGSLAIHGLLLAAILYRPMPAFVRQSSVRLGQRGALLTPIFLAQQGSGEVKHNEHTQLARTDALRYLHKKSRATHDTGRVVRGEEENSETQSASAAAGSAKQSASAGSPYGSLGEGSTTGFEIKPALPVSGPQPQVYTPNLPRGFEGDVVVEITIDEQGNITQKTLVRGLGRGLDEQAIAVLQNWRFRPATRDGIAIASKQDVYFHFVGTRS